jgi:flagellar hook assembly protein FlgD
LTTTPDSWNSNLIIDENYNGVHESNETSQVPLEIILAEDANYYLFVTLNTASQVTPNEGTAILNCQIVNNGGVIDDGSAYFGANGILYGGDDSVNSSCTAVIGYVDTDPPTVTDVKLDHQRRFDNDIITAKPLVEANIYDNLPKNVKSIEIWYNGEVAYSFTKDDNWQSPDGKTVYDEDTGIFSYEIEFEVGDEIEFYDFEIVACDNSNNCSTYLLANLTVYPPHIVEIVIGPYVYPAVAAPMRGERINIAYTLTTDANITIYVSNIAGQFVYRMDKIQYDFGGDAGYNEVSWNGKTSYGQYMSNGAFLLFVMHSETNKLLGKTKGVILDRK